MKDALAERLLAEVMSWSPQDVARERPDLQAMAEYKYDEYRQFSPGMRFVESLASWLDQFETLAERQVAYEFIKKKMIYCSSAEMYHLVAMAYEDWVKPYLLRKTAVEAGLSPWQVGSIAKTRAFAIRQRRCLFLGLSDGARIDAFRRQNPFLSHEQIRHSHEIPDERATELLKKLEEGLEAIPDGKPSKEELTFRTLVLLDDFSGSGFSYLRKEKDVWKGKLAKVYEGLIDQKHDYSKLVTLPNLEFIVVLYMATEKAVATIKSALEEVWKPLGVESEVFVVFPLSEGVSLTSQSAGAMDGLIQKYYDDENKTPSTDLGGTDLRYGFGACGLPLILSHNTPNNSIGLLWADGSKMRALFQRVSRHKKERV